jgi:hypothetical protein
MNILFMMDQRANAGSIQAVVCYVRAGDELGHTIALYGRPDPTYPGIRWSTELSAFDRVVLIVEDRINWLSGLPLIRLLSEVPRERRAILDTDGMYNSVLSVDMYDHNHTDENSRSWWVARCAALADKILQPTLEPLEVTVLPVPFYGYDSSLRVAPGASCKRFDIMHVGHNWWRWREVSSSLMPAIESIRPKLDRICFVGLWWDVVPAWVREQSLELAIDLDSELFRRLKIEVQPAVGFTEVVPVMSQGRVNIMTQRPLFRRLKLLTAKYFEIFCADTIPLVMLDPVHAESIYGPLGRELALHDNIAHRLLDAIEHPTKYHEHVEEVRCHLAAHHSYRNRVQELVRVLGD